MPRVYIPLNCNKYHIRTCMFEIYDLQFSCKDQIAFGRYKFLNTFQMMKTVTVSKQDMYTVKSPAVLLYMYTILHLLQFSCMILYNYALHVIIIIIS